MATIKDVGLLATSTKDNFKRSIRKLNLRKKWLAEDYLKGEIDIRGLVERTYNLEQINDAFQDLIDGQDGRGIIIFPN